MIQKNIQMDHRTLVFNHHFLSSVQNLTTKLTMHKPSKQASKQTSRKRVADDAVVCQPFDSKAKYGRSNIRRIITNNEKNKENPVSRCNKRVSYCLIECFLCALTFYLAGDGGEIRGWSLYSLAQSVSKKGYSIYHLSRVNPILVLKESFQHSTLSSVYGGADWNPFLQLLSSCFAILPMRTINGYQILQSIKRDKDPGRLYYPNLNGLSNILSIFIHVFFSIQSFAQRKSQVLPGLQ